MACTREDQRAAGALVISFAIGQEIAAIAIVGGPDVNRLAGLDIRAKRDELAVSIEAVTPRAPSGKDAAGDEAAEVAHHQRREFGRGARSARRRAVGVDLDTLELVAAVLDRQSTRLNYSH